MVGTAQASRRKSPVEAGNHRVEKTGCRNVITVGGVGKCSVMSDGSGRGSGPDAGREDGDVVLRTVGVEPAEYLVDDLFRSGLR